MTHASSSSISVQVILFAGLRESLGDSAFSQAIPGGSSISDLVGALGDSRGEQWLTLLSGDKIFTAVNQTMIDDRQQLLADGDEVAFFPPVTGG